VGGGRGGERIAPVDPGLEDPVAEGGEHVTRHLVQTFRGVATTLEPLKGRLKPRTYHRLLKALSVVYGIEPMVILKDICHATDRETEVVVRRMMDALVDAALREG